MSAVSYNDVDLKVIELLDYHREPVYDGPIFLWTRHRLRVRAVVNPRLTSYALNGGTLVNQIGEVAPMTDAAIRHLLQQPRKTLLWTIGTKEVLRSPAQRSVQVLGLSVAGLASYSVDADNGPKPFVYDVTRATGKKTFIVDFGVETCLTDQDLFTQTPSCLVSHRWTRTHATDEDFFSTVTTQGHAVFRTDRLALKTTPTGQTAVPDDFRAHLFHPCLQTFRRVRTSVTPTEDGKGIDYTLVDREVAFQFVKSVSRIEAWMSVSASSISAEELGMKVGAAALDFIGIEGDKASAHAIGQSMAKKGFGLALSNVPMSQVTVHVRVWGKNFTKRKTLQNIAINILSNRLERAFRNSPGAYTGSGQVNLKHDLAGRFVEVSATKLTAMTLANFAGLVNGSNLPDVGRFFDDDDQTYANGVAVIITPTNAAFESGDLPNVVLKRGSYIGSLAAQVLHDSGTLTTAASTTRPAERVAP